MVKGRYIEGSENIDAVLNIRDKVFGEECGISAANTPLCEDAMAVHGIAYNDEDEIVAAGSLYFDGISFTIDKIAVLPEYRHQYYGDFVLKILIDKAAQANPDKIAGRCFKESAGFMESVGYVITEEGPDGIAEMILPSEKFKNGCCSCKGC
ncbi:MAG: GNAT family N-acetyltransferase [Eubacterium sp.]|nr:GNAT family N-acetyltransferase [Eubacterium sp.]